MMAAALTLTDMTLGDLLGASAGGYAELEIHDLVLDSREARPGTAFIAVPGATTHGLAHASEALANGARVVLYEPGDRFTDVPEPCIAVPDLGTRLGELAQSFYGRNGGVAALAAVTGTNGKTTIAYLVAQAMAATGTPCGYIGTLGHGRPGALECHALTTPDCLTLHRELRGLATSHAMLEASSHAIAQNRLAGLEIAVAAFSNLSRDHLDQHGDMTAYGETKARLFATAGLERAVINIDDAFGAGLVARLPRGTEAVRTTLGTGASADLAGLVRLDGLDGLEIEVGGRFGTATLRSRLVGDFNAENLLLALGVLLAWQIPLHTAADALGPAMPPPGRLEVVGGASGEPFVVVDYAHTPEALARALATLRGLTAHEIWCVFGAGGDRDRGKRADMAAAAARGADQIVLTDDNPRTEDPERIVADLRAGLPEGRDAIVEHDRRRAIELAVGRARPGDVVLIAGKGHENYQLVAGSRLTFDDRVVAREALGGQA